MARPETFLFARLNIVAFNLFSDGRSKRENLMVGLTSNTAVNANGFFWGIFDAFPLETENGEYIYGKLVKYLSEGTHPVVRADTHTVESVSIENDVRAQAPFFLHINSGLLAYHPVTSNIGPSAFRRRFVEVFNRSASVQIDLASIEAQSRFLNELSAMPKVSKITIRLWPSNPNLRDKWAGVDNNLKARGIAQQKEEYVLRQDNDGSILKSDPDIDAKIAMAEDGYGIASATGEKGGKRVTISTEQKPIAAKVTTSEAEPHQVLNELKPTIDSVSDRFIQ